MSSGVRTVGLVAAREITERTHSRAFLIATAVIVALVVGGVVVPGIADDDPKLRAGLTGSTPQTLTRALAATTGAAETRLELRRYRTLAAGEVAVRDGKVDVLIVKGEGTVWESEPDPEHAAIVDSALQRVQILRRAADLGLSPADTARLLAPAQLQARSLEPPDPDRDARDAIAAVGLIVLLGVLLGYGSAVAEGVAQEKGGRIMEVLLSRVRPRDLLAGKVLGIGLIGLGQLLVLFDSVDAPDAVPAALASTVLWFVLGYAFWSVAFAAVGALVSRAEDVQSAYAPLSWILIVAYFAGFVASQSPDEWYTRVASLVPVTAPFVMPVRVAVGDVPGWEIVLAIAIMVGATYALVRLAGGVYAGALLRSGGRPRLRDVWRVQ
jgi:ABC-2 type transport system permease protein